MGHGGRTRSCSQHFVSVLLKWSNVSGRAPQLATLGMDWAAPCPASRRRSPLPVVLVLLLRSGGLTLSAMSVPMQSPSGSHTSLQRMRSKLAPHGSLHQTYFHLGIHRIHS